MRVAQVATTAISIDLLLSDQIQRLRNEGYDVEAVCAADAALPKLQKRGFPVRTISFQREPSLHHDLTSLRQLQTLFRERRYNVVHTHTPKAGLLGPVAARLAGVPVILHTIHGLLFHDRSPPLSRALGAGCELWTARWAHRLLSQSHEDVSVATKVRLCAPDRIEYLGNGIDVRRFTPDGNEIVRDRVRAELGFQETDVVVGIVGRLVEEKGYREFFDAMKTVFGKRAHARALLVAPHDPGQSDALNPDDLLSRTERHRVVHLGHRDDMPELYSAMDIFVLPTYREGVPRAAMEAAAMQVPVIASNIRGCREVVLHERTGLLVEPRQAGPLARALLRLIDEPDRRTEMGAAARRHIVAEHDADLVLDRLAAYYRRVVGPP